jgi:hypothetical protein
VKLNTDQSKSKLTRQRPVTPSSKDSISGWLDVLTSMLSLNEPQRSQVRDEMEDHLRSRVDDLLITGLSEPEAVRVAVSELGETAELAQLISNAHQRTTPRRRIMNSALIITAIAGMSIGGYSLTNGNGNNGNNSNHTNHGLVAGAGAAGIASVAAADVDSKDSEVHSFEVKNKSMKEVLNSIARTFDRTVEISWDVQRSDLGAALNVHYGNFIGEYNFTQAIDAFKSIFREEIRGYKLSITDDSILYQSYDEYQKAKIVNMIYATPSWIGGTTERHNYAESLEELLKVKHDLSYASIRVVDQAIIVAAPPEIHTEIGKLAAELDAIVLQRREQQSIEWRAEEQRMKQRAEQRAAEFQIAVDQLQQELDAARKKLLVIKQKVRVVENKIQSARNVFRGHQSDEELRAAGELDLVSQHAMLDELNLELDEAQERYTYLRNALLSSQYAQLFDVLE